MQHLDKIQALVDQQRADLQQYGMSEWDHRLYVAAQRLQADDIRLVFVGASGHGKSTLLNALLRREIIEASAIPRPIINDVRYAEAASVHLVTFQAEGPEKRDVSAALLHEAEEAADLGAYDMMEVHWPLDLIQPAGILREYPMLEGVPHKEAAFPDLMSSLLEADGVVVVLSCEALLSSSEQDFIEHDLFGAGHRQLFFVCNRLDRIAAHERESLQQYGVSRIRNIIDQSSDSTFFVSALNALEGALEQDDAQIEISDMPRLEASIAHFIQHAHASVKQGRMLYLVAQANEALRLVLSERMTELQQAQTTTGASAAVQPAELTAPLTARIDQIDKQFGEFRTITCDLIEQKMSTFLQDLVFHAQQWAEDMQTNDSSDVARQLEQQISSSIQTWQHDELEPAIRSRIERSESDLDAEIAAFLREAATLRTRLGLASTEADDHAEHIRIEFEDFVRANTLLGQSLHESGVAVDADGVDIRDIGKTLLATTVGAVILGVVGVSPFLIVPVSVLTGGFLVYRTIDDAQRRMRKGIGQKYGQRIAGQRPALIRQVVQLVEDELTKIQALVQDRLREYVANLQQEIQHLQSQAHQQRDELQQQITQLEQTQQRTQQYANQVHVLTEALAQSS
jgi:hypothetical protein